MGLLLLEKGEECTMGLTSKSEAELAYVSAKD